MHEIDQIVKDIPDVMSTHDNGNEVTVVYKSGASAVVTACVGEYGNQWQVVGRDHRGEPFDSGVIRLGAVRPSLGYLGRGGYYGSADGDRGEEFFMPEIERIIRNSYLDNVSQVSYPRKNQASIYYNMPYEKTDYTRDDDTAMVIAETGEHLGLWRVTFPENSYGPAFDSGPITLDEVKSHLTPRQSIARTTATFAMDGGEALRALDAADATADSKGTKDKKSKNKPSWWAEFSKIFR